MRLHLRNAPFLLLLTLMLPVLSACSSNNAISFPTLSFEPAADPSPMTVVARNGSVIGSGLIELDIVVTGVTDVFAVDVTMTYDPAVVRFESFSTIDSVLASDGVQTTAQASEETAGTITLGMTRTASPLGITVADTETEVLFKMRFSLAASAGSGAFTLDDDCLRDNATPPEVITGVTCSGGTFRIS